MVPELRTITPVKDRHGKPSGQPKSPYQGYADATIRDGLKAKMRLMVRAALYTGHTRLLLGMIDLLNPVYDVALCWREVLEQPEHHAHLRLWDEVVFAVPDNSEVQVTCNAFREVFEGVKL